MGCHSLLQKCSVSVNNDCSWSLLSRGEPGSCRNLQYFHHGRHLYCLGGPLHPQLDMDCHLHLLTNLGDILQVGVTKSLSAASPPHYDVRTLIIPRSCPGRWPGPMQVSRSWGKPHLVHRTLSMWNFSFENILLICFWLCWVFIAMSRFSLVVASGGLLFIAVCRLPIAVTSLVESIGVVEY